ncbi:hypothetical protein [Bosea vaviloviae]|uniref:cGAS/DncV-like nucleotidyltransferase C-terminal helical domain-containing protein n=1 Tax=Bosea vaviloviae TaxID=1526658 RepID=A0A0N0M935_9HYPH|nr:hypothetical protein [Bosea vaviloviae]KPH77314.1 hypothetical protein AE618_22415 [Bosea vaviloviae]
MPRSINDRLTNLRTRRKGLDRIDRLNDSAKLEISRHASLDEKWQRRALSQPYTRYSLGAMQAVDSTYTKKSIDEAERVSKQLHDGLAVVVETELQGSVPLDVHIRGVSDVDLLVLDGSFVTFQTSGAMARASLYGSAGGRTSLSALFFLRSEAEALLKRRYWGATVDCSGGKAISLSGGSFERPVDVVPAHWHDTEAYQASRQKHDRDVTILNKKVPETIANRPFKHIKLISDRDVAYLGGLKKAVRLVKNVKNDAENQNAANLPSFDIAALLYHADGAALRAGYINELSILAEAQRFFDWCYGNKDKARALRTPDGLRFILDSDAKMSALLSISVELDDLANQVAIEQGLMAKLGWSDVHRTLSNAYIPDAA